MNKTVKSMLEDFDLGALQKHENLQVCPLLYSGNHSPEYLTLKEALEQRVLVVKELMKEGSVPELLVKNKSDSPVLLLDGEELMGAKQNRVLNTTILLKEKSKTVIPVSCTEQGRWSYSSPLFADSNVVAASRVRASKLSSVSQLLRSGEHFRSDQNEVWESVEDLASEAGVSSPTGAMKDIFESRQKELAEYLDKFPIIERQRGLIFLNDGKVTGMDYISYEPAFKLLHQKLIKSYALDAMMSKKLSGKKGLKKVAQDFLKKTETCQEKKYQSVGYGWDHRYDGDDLVGSALVYNNTVIHMAFFSIDKSEKIGRMSSSSRRRDYRIL
ncbi:MAG: hypothetical protein JXL67_12485 [Calditrichaeota bacterium]|nr:hypothetical protein [Calditrichota bacterium]